MSKTKTLEQIITEKRTAENWHSKRREYNRTHTRSFGGKTVGFNSIWERNFEKKHLQAYLKGHRQFSFGFTTDPITKLKEQVWYNVQEKWTKNKQPTVITKPDGGAILAMI